MHSFVRRSVLLCLFVAASYGPIPVRGDDFSSFRAAARSIRVPDLKRHLVTLAADSLEGRESGSRGGQAAGVYLLQELKKLGLKPGGKEGDWFQEFGAGYRNLLAVLPGSDDKLGREIVIIGGHYDHVGYGNAENSAGPIGYIHNGADDNASGVSLLLELAEACTQLDPGPRRTLLFAFWDAEERGLLGSKHWVSQPTLDLQRVKAVVNVDMVGRLREDRLEVFGSRSFPGLRRWLTSANEEPALTLDFQYETPPNSDHYPFYARRIPFVMPFTGYHDDYHRPSDDVDKVNAEGIERIGRWLLAVIRDFADRDEIPRFRTAIFQENALTKRGLESSRSNRGTRLGISWDATDKGGPGLRVSQVVPGSAAAQAGLAVNDRLVAFGGFAVEPGDDLRGLVLTAKNPVTAVVRRGEAADLLELALELPGTPVRIGITWSEDDADPETVVLNNVLGGSAADRAGLRPGDRILRVGDLQPIQPDQFRERISSQPFPFTVQVERTGQLHELTLQQLDAKPWRETTTAPLSE